MESPTNIQSAGKEAALDYAISMDTVGLVETLAERQGLGVSVSDLLVFVERLIEGNDGLERLPDLLRASGIPEEQILPFAVVFTGNVLKPVAPLIGDIETAIRAWGGNPADFSEVEILPELRGVNVEEITPAPVVSLPVPTPAPTPTPARRPPPAPALVRGADILAPEDAAELAQHAAKAESVKATAPEISAEPAVRAVVVAAGLKDADTQKRLAKIVEARLKDVRDAYATRAEIEKPASSGGLGLTGSALADLMEKIESAAYEAKREADQRAAKDKSAHMERGIARRDAGSASREQEEQLLARRYAELTGKAPTKTVGAIGARPSLAMSARESIAQAAKKIDTAKVKQAVAASAPPTLRPAAPRPRMEDVRPAHRLAGPVDELRLLTLEDFRRLSKDPKTAMAKVLDQAELLRSQGEDQWFAAVKAWRASPLNGWYVNVVQEALSRGTEVRSLLAEKRAAGEIVPSDAEVDAVVALNGRLRF